MVIAGASSGIGRATARRLGACGARVVLAARSEAALEAVASEVERAGGHATVVPTDVAEWAAVEALAGEAVSGFGRIDSWVNAAAVSTYGNVADIPVDAFRRVIEVDLLGQVHGVKAALPVMRAQGAGTIIGISSILGVRSVPLQVPYCVAKHGLTALYEGLRLEERRASSGVQVSVVLPSSVNTPFYDQAPSWLGRRPRAIPPVYQPDVVARAVVSVVERPRRHVIVGGAGAQLFALQRLSPAMTDRLLTMGGAIFRLQRAKEEDGGQNNLYDPMEGSGAVEGRFGGQSLRHSAYTAGVALRPSAARAAVVSAGVAALTKRWWR